MLCVAGQVSPGVDRRRTGQSDQQPGGGDRHHQARHDHPATDHAAQNHDQPDEERPQWQRRGFPGCQ